ncbi:UDP-glucuronosyltransferase 2C1 [Aplysia californica]|uniref:UDP-glucuronosyltransferase 2C1 n=1 Tax=Aplysia californica TaxID=6500 RepID=A0ABM1VWI2_APLCA|nr:UDP-glucuronosyltransferase 2C1 [Aplysia californica]XP_005102691.1 UDP-glucuronosyltransferase 2C1 [Aplysia californica]XP_035826774.1 UDP-glucuronosyltransferase 2C1 [Aplysia californica]
MTSAAVTSFLAAATLLLAGNHHVSQAKTVVLFSPPHAANVRTYTNTGRALAALGHDVYVPVPDFMLKDNSVNVQGIKVIRYGEYLGHFDDKIATVAVNKFWRNQSMNLGDVPGILNLFNDMVTQILSDKQLVAKFKEIKPDMFVLVKVPFFRDFVILPYMLHVPFSFLCPFHDYVGQRVPISLSSTPLQLNDDFQEEGMTFFQRLKNSMAHLALFFFHEYASSDKLVAKFAPHRPRISTKEIMSQAEIFIVESDPIMDFARPHLPNTKFVGSTAGTSPKELKEPFKSFMEKSVNGVVVVTFGSSILEVPDYISSKMVSAFLKLKQNVVWRVKLQSPDPGKILTSSWVPQNDLLGHKNTKLFVSHCGMNGQYEGMYHAVPTLCLPFESDMPYNAQRGVAKGFGLKADIREVTDIELLALMREMLENNKYKKNIQKASDLYKELYKLPVNETAFWLDHVMKYGGAYMRSAGQNMPMYQFLALDVLAFVAVVKVFVVVFVYKTCRCCCGLCCGKKRKSKSD